MINFEDIFALFLPQWINININSYIAASTYLHLCISHTCRRYTRNLFSKNIILSNKKIPYGILWYNLIFLVAIANTFLPAKYRHGRRIFKHLKIFSNSMQLCLHHWICKNSTPANYFELILITSHYCSSRSLCKNFCAYWANSATYSAGLNPIRNFRSVPFFHPPPSPSLQLPISAF